MKIEKFNLIKNGKIVYAVSGTEDLMAAMDEVRKYKKENIASFYSNHSCFEGTIHNNKLYVGNVDYAKKKPCIIVSRNNYNIISNIS